MLTLNEERGVAFRICSVKFARWTKLQILLLKSLLNYTFPCKRRENKSKPSMDGWSWLEECSYRNRSSYHGNSNMLVSSTMGTYASYVTDLQHHNSNSNLFSRKNRLIKSIGTESALVT